MGINHTTRGSGVQNSQALPMQNFCLDECPDGDAINTISYVAIAIITATGIATAITSGAVLPAMLIIGTTLAIDISILAASIIFGACADCCNNMEVGPMVRDIRQALNNPFTNASPYAPEYPPEVPAGFYNNLAVNGGHFEAVSAIESALPRAPEIPLNTIVELFDCANFDIPLPFLYGAELSPGEIDNGIAIEQFTDDYVDPATGIKDEGVTIVPKESLRRTLQQWIGHIQNRDYMAGVPSGNTERDAYYQKLEVLLKHTLVKFSQYDFSLVFRKRADGTIERINPKTVAVEDVPKREQQVKLLNQMNSLIFSIGCGMRHCAGRVMSEVLAAYYKAVLGMDADNLETEAKRMLHEMRYGIIQMIVLRNHTVNDVMQAHAIIEYLQHLSGPRGILGRDLVEYNDPYRTLRISQEQALRYFDERYVPGQIVEAVKGWIDGIPLEGGARIRAVDNELVINWFKAHIAEGWKAGQVQIPLEPKTDTRGNPINDAQGRPIMVPEYRDSADRPDYADHFLRKFVLTEDGKVKREAVIHLLKTIGVLNN